MFFLLKKYEYTCIFVYCVILTLVAQAVPFFWDNVLLASKIAQFYYENRFSSLILPQSLDSGHPPFYGMYLAVVWMLFGKSLPAAHWAVLPFLVGLGIAYYRLLCYILPRRYAFWGLIFLFAEPAFLTQSVLAGIDIPLVGAHLLLLQGLLYRQRKAVMFGAIGLCLFSLRGILTAFFIGLCDVLLCLYRGERHIGAVLKNTFPAWLPALTITAVWYVYHYYNAGFLAINHHSVWATDPDSLHYKYANLNAFLRNVAIVGWRFLDQGRVIVWLILGYGFYSYYYKARKIINSQQGCVAGRQIEWLIVCFLPLVFMTIIVAARHNPIMPRYFLTYFLLLPPTALYLLVGERQKSATGAGLSFLKLNDKKLNENANTPKTQPINTPQTAIPQKQVAVAAVLMAVSLLSGHFWIYPYPVANSWDTTLRCLPYFGVKQKMYNYMNARHIPFDQTASAFPLLAAPKYTDLDEGDSRTLIPVGSRPQRDFAYFCVSNCSNEFKPADLQRLQAPPWQMESRFENKGIWIELYRQIGN